MRISDWSSDVCSSDLPIYEPGLEPMVKANHAAGRLRFTTDAGQAVAHGEVIFIAVGTPPDEDGSADLQYVLAVARTIGTHLQKPARSEEHTSELQSLMRISYAVFCLKKKKKQTKNTTQQRYSTRVTTQKN